jgi:hypothetical protein
LARARLPRSANLADVGGLLLTSISRVARLELAEAVMKARHLIESASYGPETLKVIGQAFDDAWSSISSHLDPSDRTQIEAARTRLAHAVLAVATDTNLDPGKLKDAALQVFAMTYRSRLGQAGPTAV